MKKVLVCILALMLVLMLSVPVLAAGSVVGTKNSTYTMGASEDHYGYEFENVTPGVYKLALYVDVDSITTGKQLRFSPKVFKSASNTSADPNERRCWIDFRFTAAVYEAFEDSGKEKIMMVAVIKVPEGYDKINAGFWQDDNTVVGSLEKVVLATSDYNLYDQNYFLVGEYNYRGNTEGDGDHSNNTFGEDPEQKLLAPAGSWVASAKPSNNNGGNQDPNTETPNKTSDASMMVTLIVAGAAAFGGLKLRKK